MGSKHRWLLTGCGVALLLLAQGLHVAAWASEVSSADRETARGLMEQGDERYEKGEWGKALEFYRGAHEIMKVPTTGIALARALGKMGKLVEARDIALQVTRMPVQPGEHAVFGEAREEARRLSEDIEPRIPSVQVKLTGDAPPKGVKVQIDGRELPGAAALLPRAVNPGKVVVVVRGEGIETATAEVLVSEREAREVEVQLRAGSDSSVSDTSQLATGPTATSPLVYVGFGIGAVGLIAGTATGLMANSQTSDLKDKCGDSVCPPSLHGDYDSANRMATISNVSFGVGLVGIGLGVYGLVTGSGGENANVGRSEGVQWQAMVGPELTGVRGRF